MKLNFVGDNTPIVQLRDFVRAVGCRKELYKEAYGNRPEHIPPEEHWWWQRTFIYDGYVFALVDRREDGSVNTSQHGYSAADPNYALAMNLSSHTLRAIHMESNIEPINTKLTIEHANTKRYPNANRR